MKSGYPRNHTLAFATLLCLSALGGTASAEMTADEASRLSTTLTPVGAERAANKDASIPAWDGGITAPPAGFDRSKGYLNPYASDKPLYTITGANAEKYKDRLAAGQIEMLKRFPSFKMNVYASRRTAAYPKSIYELAKSEGMKTKLAEGGNGVLNMEKGTVPFPIPKSGIEVQWNHQARFYGGTWTRYNAEFPVQSNGSFTPVTRDETFAAPWAMEKSDPNRLYYYLSRLTGPSNVAGDGILVHEPVDQVKEPRLAWVYNPGTRRVLRAPQVAYDAPGNGSDGLRTIDDYLGFSGAPDRYDWKLVGKKEMFISYNNFALSDKSLKYSSIIQPNHMNPDLVRYEPHRVWVVEATLKAGLRHIYAKRTFYVDEDSWSIAHVDQYDGRGELWRVRDVHLMPFYDQSMTWGIAEVLYDLQARRYIASGMMNEEKPMKFAEKLSLNFFAPESMRRQGK
jgi:hypothetical protein